MKIALISTLSALALLAPAAPATAKPAVPPKAPPKVLAGPSGTTVDEKTPITFRIKAHALFSRKTAQSSTRLTIVAPAWQPVRVVRLT